MVAISIHGDGPVDQVEIDIIQAQQLQADIHVFFAFAVVRAPQFRRDEEIAAGEARGCQSIADPLTDLLLVLVNVGAVNVAVSSFDRVSNGRADLALGALPGS
jgi:hypothetical protein